MTQTFAEGNVKGDAFMGGNSCYFAILSETPALSIIHKTQWD